MVSYRKKLYRKHQFCLFVSVILILVLASCQAGVPGVIFAQEPGNTATLTPFQAWSPTPRASATALPPAAVGSLATQDLSALASPAAGSTTSAQASLSDTVTPAPVPNPTEDTCWLEQGTIEEKQEVFSAEPLHFRIYFPPCFGSNTKVRYPVIYMIHGQTFKDDQWERLDIGPAADELIREKAAPPFLIVMPQEDDTFEDIYAGSFGRDFTDGLIRWIDETYPTCAERACRAIGGLSRGGAWALHLGFTHWELFSAIGLHSTPPFIGDPQQFSGWLYQIPQDQVPRVYMDIGRNDPFLSNASQFEDILVATNVAHEWYLFNGNHNEEYWSSHVMEYLQWYVKPWNDLPQDFLSK